VETGFPSGQTRSVCPEIMLNYEGSDGSSLATLRQSVGRIWRLAVRPPSDSKSRIQKARDRFPGAGSILAMLNICR